MATQFKLLPALNRRCVLQLRSAFTSAAEIKPRPLDS